MKKPSGRYRIALAAAVAVLLLAGERFAAPAQTGPPAPPDEVTALLDRLSANPLTPASYSAAVTMRVKLRTFPFVSLTLRGSSTYARPGSYTFAFHGFPVIARQFERMNFDLGDPKEWPKTFDVSLRSQAPNGDAVLRLTPRASKIVRYVDVEVDANKGHLRRAVWSRFDNGTFVLVEHYANVGKSEVCTNAQAQVAISAIRANLNIEFADFVIHDLAAKEDGGS